MLVMYRKINLLIAAVLIGVNLHAQLVQESDMYSRKIIPRNSSGTIDPGGYFGHAIDISQDIIAASGGSSVYVYQKDAIIDIAKPTPESCDIISKPSGSDGFGIDVSIEMTRGNRQLVVGAWKAGATNTGKVHYYSKSGSCWQSDGVLEPPTTTTNGHYGYSVQSNDKWLVVGAPGAAKAYVYDMNAGNPQATEIELLGATGTPLINFGVDVELSGDLAFVSDFSARYVHIYNLANASGSTLTPEYSLHKPISAFGYSISASESLFAVSALSSEEVYIYDVTLSGGTISVSERFSAPLKKDLDTLIEDFGHRISVASNSGQARILVGARLADVADDGGIIRSDAGCVFVYDENGTETSMLKASTVQSNTRFGEALAQDEENILVGSMYNYSDESYQGINYYMGAIYVYTSAVPDVDFKFQNFWETYTVSSSGGCITLTNGGGYANGNAHTWEKINLTNDFTMEAMIHLGANPAGGDGMVFVFQNTIDYSSYGSFGMGYGGINFSVGVEFDTYHNGSFDPAKDATAPVDDHVALVAGGSLSPITTPVAVGELEDDSYHDLKVNWDASLQSFKVHLDGVLVVDYAGDIVSLLGGNPNVHWGFTAHTGGSPQNAHGFCLKSLLRTPISYRLASPGADLNKPLKA